MSTNDDNRFTGRCSSRTDVACIAGAAAISFAVLMALNSPSAQAGVPNRGHANGVEKRPKPEESVWCGRWLVYYDTPLGVIVAHYNLHNRYQIRIIDASVADYRLTATLCEGYPYALLLALMRDRSLSVQAAGEDWVVRARTRSP